MFKLSQFVLIEKIILFLLWNFCYCISMIYN